MAFGPLADALLVVFQTNFQHTQLGTPSAVRVFGEIAKVALKGSDAGSGSASDLPPGQPARRKVSTSRV